MEPFKKIINPGTMPIGGRNREVFCRIQYDKAGRLSISGVIGPWHSGNCAGPCGQIVDELKDIRRFHRGWNYSRLFKIITAWKKWHLNDLHHKTVPETVLQYLRDLSETKQKPAWV